MIGTSEAAIVLEASKVHPAPAHVRRLSSLLDQPFDGPRLQALALRHEVHPLLDRALDRAGLPQALPWREKLKVSARHALARNLVLDRELSRVLRSLAQRGISALSLKGPRFAREVYGGIGLRTSGDLDLFVQSDQLAPAVDALQGLGYRLQAPLNARQLDRLRPYDKALILTRKGLPLDVSVDLHWNPWSPRYGTRSAAADIWRRARAVPKTGRESLGPEPEDMLLFLLVHGYNHNWDRLKLACDVDAFVHRFGEDIDWDLASWRARAWKIEDITAPGAHVVRSLLGTRIPSVTHGFGTSGCRMRQGFASPQSFLAGGGTGPASPGRALIEQLRVRRGAVRKIRHFFRSLRPTAKDFGRWPALSRFVGLLWLLRPLRVALALRAAGAHRPKN